VIWERCWALFPDASALLYEPPLLALILRNGIIKPGLDWVNDDSLKAIQVFFFSGPFYSHFAYEGHKFSCVGQDKELFPASTQRTPIPCFFTFYLFIYNQRQEAAR